MPGNRRIVTYITMCISNPIDDRIVCKHAQRPQADTMARDRFIPASLQPQRLTRQRYPGLRTDLNRDHYLSPLSIIIFAIRIIVSTHAKPTTSLGIPEPHVHSTSVTLRLPTSGSTRRSDVRKGSCSGPLSNKT